MIKLPLLGDERIRFQEVLASNKETPWVVTQGIAALTWRVENNIRISISHVNAICEKIAMFARDDETRWKLNDLQNHHSDLLWSYHCIQLEAAKKTVDELGSINMRCVHAKMLVILEREFKTSCRISSALSEIRARNA